MDHREILEEIDTCLKTAIGHGLGSKGLIFPVDPITVEDEELRAICNRFATIFDMINESYQYSERLARGDLSAKSSRNNIFSMPLKGLQASLAHMTWQARQVAEGDLNQQVHFLGEFSYSFNCMILSLREKEIIKQRLKQITDVLGEGVLLVDSDGKIIFANPEAMRLLGYSFDEIEGCLIHEVIHKQQPDGTLYNSGENPFFNAIVSGNDYNNDDGVFTCKSGLLMPISFACRAVFKNETRDGAVIAFRDITVQKKNLQSLEGINELLEKQASTDALTGIFNRMKFNQTLTSEIKRAKRYRVALSLILFDIDHFKQVNDSYGHLSGDTVLKHLARLVASNLREIDIFARWGGEEFVIQAPETSLESAIKLAEKLRSKIENYVFPAPKKITVSFGVATFRSSDNDITLVNRADEALYRAKEGGRNQVVSHA
ncbi:GGDEF domain family protein [Desulforapulum autotrophicum HRM2]|uniref:diguanylate cyclase n=1 Tax=Desulforapulum autotrophicum (strain ATCC 43914 / DSM 3382 / VKM B-1955 / HRM2) TaxID=177437 RepID=C0QBK1_DESAH|nr:sensor domain-containing diguanylate cyclase [Desulforapulum autotrophicum]ACN17003.1 GGDEF domain family protein [Desulforapulum autotrophicum HRM2]